MRVDLLAHAVKHFAYRVYTYFATLVAVQRKANCEVLSQAQEHRIVGFQRRRLFGDARQGLLQEIARAPGELRKLLLKGPGLEACSSARGLAQLR